MSLKAKAKSSKKRTQSQNDSSSDSEHELFYYHNDRVQLMKEVLKILKLKKIKALAPPGIKRMEMEEINALLLEELLGISNKRLKKILEGKNADDESSSSDEEKIDVISLDSISDDEICFVDETMDDADGKQSRREKCRRRKHRLDKIKSEKDSNVRVKAEHVKTEKQSASGASKGEKSTASRLENEKLLSVLELLELQARARAIRSQLALEAENKAKEAVEAQKAKGLCQNDDDDDDAVIIETPVINEIVISSSDSEAGLDATKLDCGSERNSAQHMVDQENSEDAQTVQLIEKPAAKKAQKVKLIRNILVEATNSAGVDVTDEAQTSAAKVDVTEIPLPRGDGTECILAQIESTDGSNDINCKVNDDKVQLMDIMQVAEAATALGHVFGVKTVKEIGLHVRSATDVDMVDSEVSTVKNKVGPVITEHDDHEDDVIRLDIVEIDGIDD